MNNTQESTLSMSVGTINYLIKNASITSILPGFEPLFTKFKDNINGILFLHEQQEIDKSGISENKEFLRADLASKAYDISHKTEVYATLVNNLILAKEVHFPETSLSKATDSKLESRVLIIIEKVNASINELIPYGVVPDDLTALQNAFELFHAAIPAPRAGTVDRKSVTDQLNKLFKDNKLILDKIDLLIDIVRLSQPVFYSGYKDSRKIIQSGNGSLALTAKASDAETGEGIKGVKFTFVLQNGNGENAKREESFVRITAQKGRLNIKNMSDGTYKTIVAKTGYKQKELIVNKAAGDRIKLDIQLEKS